MGQITRATTSASSSPTPLLSYGDARGEEYRDPVSMQIQPLVLSFSNLSYSVKIRHSNIFHRSSSHISAKESETKVLLNDVSGEALDGEILAVLGPSGSGKSTLIDALAGRMVKGSLKGTINLNGEPLESKLLKVISAYVMQDDLLYPMLTVEETLMFAAELRLPRTLSKSNKKRRVQDLIDQLDLRNAAQTFIGDEGHRGVSGGERRRVSIGIDILHDPILLFLDEPTSGLDSTSAFAVVKVLRRIAQTGSIVIMSIHQPSFRILQLLDRLIFLSHGQIVYSGSPSNLPSYLADLGHPIAKDQNPSEAALDLICDLQCSAGGIRSLVEFNQAWKLVKGSAAEVEPFPTPVHGCSLQGAIISSISRGKLVSGRTNYDATSTLKVRTFANPFWIEILVLLKRSFLNSRRMPELLTTRFLSILVIAIILASLFWQLDLSPRGNVDRIRFLGFVVTTVYYNCGDALGTILQERSIFLRESAYNSYRKFSYCVSDALSWLPSLLFASILFGSITFWGVGLGGGFAGFIFYLGIIMASFWAGNSFVTLILEVFSHVLLATVIIVAIFGYFFLFCGLYVSPDRIPRYWLWFHYISLQKYSFAAVLRNEYDEPSKCVVKGIQTFDYSPLASVSTALKEELLNTISETLGVNITSSTCLSTGPDILKRRGITDLRKWECFWIIIAWGFFFRILFYIALSFGNKNKRK